MPPFQIQKNQDSALAPSDFKIQKD